MLKDCSAVLSLIRSANPGSLMTHEDLRPGVNIVKLETAIMVFVDGTISEIHPLGGSDEDLSYALSAYVRNES